MNISRRRVLAGVSALPLVIAADAQSPQAERAAERARAELTHAKGTKLVLLGTGGGPLPGRPRCMTSNLILSDGAAYIVDCGLGVTNRLASTGTPFEQLRAIFITHHHPDHNVEYGPLLVIGWVEGLQASVRAFGPPPLRQMTEDFFRAYKTTIDFWAEDFKINPLESITVKEVSTAGPVMQDDKVKVQAAVVSHPPVTPALAYRFDFNDRSIAFSGDTAPSDAVVQIAKGADVLVHEAMYGPAVERYAKGQIAKGQPIQFENFMAHMRADHTTVETVGRIAHEAGVKTLVLSHLSPAIDSLDDDTWRTPAARYFKGEIIVGKDLMVI